VVDSGAAPQPWSRLTTYDWAGKTTKTQDSKEGKDNLLTVILGASSSWKNERRERPGFYQSVDR
jgi:hypothetical protein